MSAAINVFQHEILEYTPNLREAEKNTAAVFSENGKCLGAELKKQRHSKNGTVLHEYSARIKTYLRIARVSLHNFYLEKFRIDRRHCSSDIVRKLSWLSVGCNVQRLNNR